VAFQYYWVHKTRLDLTQVPLWLSRELYTAKTSLIPKIIHQTHPQKHRIPKKVDLNFQRFASEYKRIVYDDNQIEVFLHDNFHPRVLECFQSLKKGCHKADLFRYCVLYVHGGIYMDIKTELVGPIEHLFPDDVVTTVMTNSRAVYQGIIAAPPRQPIFLTLIEGILRSGSNPVYNLFLLEFMRYIKADGVSPKEGELLGNKHRYKLLTEKCTKNKSQCYDGLDRYGLCCKVFYAGREVIKTRYADYPW
jgi:hypothetical protein